MAANGIHKHTQFGDNSTNFTLCCDCAICDAEKNCPKCGEPVIGWDCASAAERGKVRWLYTTAEWSKL